MTEELAAEQPARIAVQTASRPIREGLAPPALLVNSYRQIVVRRQGRAPKSTKISRNARRFKREDVDAWIAAGGLMQYAAGASDA